MDVAIIGAGTIGHRLSRSFMACEKTNVKYVVDIVEEKARELAQQIGANYHTDYSKVIDDVDILYIGVPPKYHAEIAIEAIESGKHVICEKPIASNTNDAKRMVSAALDANVVSTINLPFRFSPAIARMKQAINENEFGNLRHCELRFRFPVWPRKWQNVEWLKSRDQGGALREVGTHYFFALFELFGNVNQVMAFTTFPSPKKCESDSVGLIVTPKTKVSFSLIIGSSEEEENTFFMYFDKNVLKFSKWYLLELFPNGSTLVEDRVNAELEMVNAFVKAIEGNPGAKNQLVSFKDAFNAQLVLDAIYRSNGKWISI